MTDFFKGLWIILSDFFRPEKPEPTGLPLLPRKMRKQSLTSRLALSISLEQLLIMAQVFFSILLFFGMKSGAGGLTLIALCGMSMLIGAVGFVFVSLPILRPWIESVQEKGRE